MKLFINIVILTYISTYTNSIHNPIIVLIRNNYSYIRLFFAIAIQLLAKIVKTLSFYVGNNYKELSKEVFSLLVFFFF